MKVAIASNDAGGAELVSSYLRQKGLEGVFTLSGPAREIFERKLGNVKATPLEEAIDQADWLLCGTSGKSDLECRAIALARARGKRSVAFLDHWTNYRGRFLRAGIEYLPDAIWVGDSIAFSIASSIFPESSPVLVPNPYYIDIQMELSALSSYRRPTDGKANVLYVCEPMVQQASCTSGNDQHAQYAEQDALRFFFNNLHVIGAPIGQIVIRPHPSEARDKYLWVQQEFDAPISFGRSKSLLEDILDSDVVVGCETMAMVVGLLAARRVVSCIPPGGRPCSLPQPEIEHLTSLIRRHL